MQFPQPLMLLCLLGIVERLEDCIQLRAHGMYWYVRAVTYFGLIIVSSLEHVHYPTLRIA